MKFYVGRAYTRKDGMLIGLNSTTYLGPGIWYGYHSEDCQHCGHIQANSRASAMETIEQKFAGAIFPQPMTRRRQSYAKQEQLKRARSIVRAAR